MADVDAILDRCTRLCSVPGVITRLIGMLSSGDYQPEEMVKLIRSDEGIAAAILRAANSAAFGAPGTTFSLEQGIVRLGSRNLMKVALGQQSNSMLKNGGCAYGLRRIDLWKEAVSGAIAAERFARIVEGVEPGEAYAAALLRDIGKLAIDSAFNDHVLEDIDSNLATREGYEAAERALLGIDHAALGAALAARWSMPERIVRTIRLHHAPEPPGGADADVLTDVVHVSDIVSMWAGFALGEDGLSHRMADHVGSSLGLTRQCIEQVIVEVRTEMDSMEEAVLGQSNRSTA